MCEVCSSEGKNYKFNTGDKPLKVNSLYKVFKDNVASVKLCHVHDIELFMLGEKRFLTEHLPYARVLASKSHRSDNDSSLPFGF